MKKIQSKCPPMTHDKLMTLIKSHALPDDFIQTVKRWYVPLAADIAQSHNKSPLLIGVQGSQGSGKSTLAAFLRHLLAQEYSLHCVDLSLDDFYLTLAERKKLARTVHPLFITRGVPGTHDTSLATDTINALLSADNAQHCFVPRFSKALDDRVPRSDWDTVNSPVDVVIFEGWCVGIEAQVDSALESPINDLERVEDPDASWRSYSNQKLKTDYAKLFSMLDKLIVLEAPSFESVYDWRRLQEQKLIEQWQRENTHVDHKLLDESGLRRFISHYERLTRHSLATLHDRADWLLSLNDQHHITNLVERK